MKLSIVVVLILGFAATTYATIGSMSTTYNESLEGSVWIQSLNLRGTGAGTFNVSQSGVHRAFMYWVTKSNGDYTSSFVGRYL